MLYCIKDEGRTAEAVAWAGIDPGHDFCAGQVSVQEADNVLEVLRVGDERQAGRI